MELLTKLKNIFTGSTDAVKDDTSSDIETMSDTKQESIEVVKEAGEKKDNCCGGNCGS